MPSAIEIIRALGAVQETLDLLTSRGKDQHAFSLARAQFAASVRTSWPANLGPLVKELESLVADQTAELTADETTRITEAIATLTHE